MRAERDQDPVLYRHRPARQARARAAGDPRHLGRVAGAHDACTSSVEPGSTTAPGVTAYWSSPSDS